MESAWSRAKRALALNLCVTIPRTRDDEAEAVVRSPVAEAARSPAPAILSPASSGSRSSKRICAICLSVMKTGRGHALFTAECSHTFHFQCISSNVKHGNYLCPVCRAKWKEMPSHVGPPPPPADSGLGGRSRVNPINLPHDDSHLILLRRFASLHNANRQHQQQQNQNQLPSHVHPSEPVSFNDDEPVTPTNETSDNLQNGSSSQAVKIETYAESSAVRKSVLKEDFGILIHLKAPCAGPPQGTATAARTPIDLVTVLDVSGSMAGTKLSLLKRAMSFVIQNLGPSDRLSVISFSSMARRLFPLSRMSDSGRRLALQAVNSLNASGGTNIAEGLKKGVKVIEERMQKNPVCSIILLSDGQDTYNIPTSRAHPDYRLLLPSSILRPAAGYQLPVHTFGFGVDHDSGAMHSIAEISRGTFSFIEAEGVIQDAFAQCIGGLLSVVVQGMGLSVQCVAPGVLLSSVHSGSYVSQVAGDGRAGSIDVGDLYADEDRDFLVSVSIPPVARHESVDTETVLIKVSCTYKDPVTEKTLMLEGEELTVPRPEADVSAVMSIEVDRERNRVRAANAMSAARAAAERGELSEAVSVLEQCRSLLVDSIAALAGDRLCLALDAELREMQHRMASRQRYEESGRAYVLSGLSSHLLQRATARGDSTESDSLFYSYQTPSMVDMLQRSQTFLPSPRRLRPAVRPTKSFAGRSHPW